MLNPVSIASPIPPPPTAPQMSAPPAGEKSFKDLLVDSIDQVNAMYSPIRMNKRSDLVLLPVVAKMDPAPASVSSLEKAMLVAAGTSGWSAAEAWANAEPQRAVLAALKEVVRR